MIKVAGVKFPYSLKVVDYKQGRNKINPRDFVVVDSQQGLEIGQALYTDREIEEAEELDLIIRVAGEDDLEKNKKLEAEAREYFPIFKEKIIKYNLKMKPIGVSYSLDKSKLIFYFSAEGRVDFRELARDLSRSIKKQAILRQIGPRDEAKIIGGHGRCGLPVCCATFLTGTESITMEDAEQAYGMPKSAAKISGICGRLMCCIKYEIEDLKGDKK